jgi:hypothetical protein
VFASISAVALLIAASSSSFLAQAFFFFTYLSVIEVIAV